MLRGVVGSLSWICVAAAMVLGFRWSCHCWGDSGGHPVHATIPSVQEMPLGSYVEIDGPLPSTDGAVRLRADLAPAEIEGRSELAPQDDERSAMPLHDEDERVWVVSDGAAPLRAPLRGRVERPPASWSAHPRLGRARVVIEERPRLPPPRDPASEPSGVAFVALLGGGLGLAALARRLPRRPAPIPAPARRRSKRGGAHTGERSPQAPPPPADAIDAHARITWGERPDRVVAALVEGGATTERAHALVGLALRRRHALYRRMAVVDVLGGVLLVLLFAADVTGPEHAAFVVPRTLLRLALGWLGVPWPEIFLGALYLCAPLLIGRGAARLWRGGDEEGAASDVVEG